MAIRANGEIAVGGTIDEVNGIPVQNLVLLRRDGTHDADFIAKVNGEVNKILWQDEDRLLIAGAFTEVNGARCDHLARLRSNGTVDPSFNAQTGLDDAVYAMALQGGKIVVGGSFSFAGDDLDYVNGLARFLEDGAYDATFASTITTEAVSDILVQADEKLVVTGEILKLTKTDHKGLVRLDPNGSVDSTFASGLDLTATWTNDRPVGMALGLQPDGDILVAGYFNIIGELQRARVGRVFGKAPAPEAPRLVSPLFNRTARVGQSITLSPVVESLWPTKFQWSFTNDSSSTVLSAKTNQTLTIASVTQTNQGNYLLTAEMPDGSLPLSRATLTALPANATAGLPDPSSFTGLGANGPILAVLSQTNRASWVGGRFSQYQGKARNGLARLNQDGSLDETIEASLILAGAVHCLVPEDADHFLAGGHMSDPSGGPWQLALRSLGPVRYLVCRATESRR